MKAGEVVLIRLTQFAGGAQKLRPALLLALLPGPYQTHLLCGISTQLSHLRPDWDELIQPGDIDFSLKLVSVHFHTRGPPALFPPLVKGGPGGWWSHSRRADDSIPPPFEDLSPDHFQHAIELVIDFGIQDPDDPDPERLDVLLALQVVYRRA